MKKFLKNHRVLTCALSVLMSVFLVTVITYAATTIGTSIDTGGYASSTSSLNTSGTLWVGGNAQIDGNATTTGNTTTTGSLYVNGTASSTALAIQGDAHIGGNASTSGLTIGATSTTHISSFLFGVCDADFSGDTASGAATSSNCAATGVVPGDRIFVTAREALTAGFVFMGATNTDADYIGIHLWNATNSVVTGSEYTFQWMAIR